MRSVRNERALCGVPRVALSYVLGKDMRVNLVITTRVGNNHHHNMTCLPGCQGRQGLLVVLQAMRMDVPEWTTRFVISIQAVRDSVPALCFIQVQECAKIT